MIEHGTESPVICQDCNGPAWRITVPVRHPGSWRLVSYDTHHQGMNSPDHLAALNRLDAFHKRMDALEIGLKAKMPYYAITAYDLGSVCPTACAVRTLVTPILTISAYGLTGEVGLAPCALKGMTVDKLLKMSHGPMRDCVGRLKARFEPKLPDAVLPEEPKE